MDRHTLPSVHETYLRLAEAAGAYPRDLVIDEIRRVLNLRRNSALSQQSIEQDVLDALDELRQPTLRGVINATGVILHTNLGRAPLGPLAIEPDYTNLEYDLAAGRRGKRDAHFTELLERLLQPAEQAIAVNNGAAAVFLALNELATGYEAIVSRGELIEIGDGFRIPEIMARSGVILREVGTTNRTSIEDYRDALNDRTRILLRVHRSNFRISGFTARPSLPELTALGREQGIPVYEDLGSGCLIDLKPYGIDEPLVSDSLKAGVDLVTFSGDKLLGGPQAGIVAGKAELVSRLRRNPIYRALRLDKLSVQALSTSLRNLVLGDLDQIPVLRMIRQTADQVRARAERLIESLPLRIVPGESMIGGGATPEQNLPTYLIAIDTPDPLKLERQLRTRPPYVIARIERDQVLLDLRTVMAPQESTLRHALEDVLGLG